MSNAEAARLMLESDHADLEELREIVGDILDADRRAADVITRLRALLRRGDPDLRESRLSDVVDEAVGHLADDYRTHGIRLDRSESSSLPPVLADRILLVQVILNLLSNARDAVVNNPEGERIVNLETSTDGRNVFVTVTDNGSGIDGDLAEIFSPFVTTKKKGLGMGLAISRSIVEAHEGSIEAQSKTGSGALFRVSIPRKSDES